MAKNKKIKLGVLTLIPVVATVATTAIVITNSKIPSADKKVPISKEGGLIQNGLSSLLIDNPNNIEVQSYAEFESRVNAISYEDLKEKLIEPIMKKNVDFKTEFNKEITAKNVDTLNKGDFIKNAFRELLQLSNAGSFIEFKGSLKTLIKNIKEEPKSIVELLKNIIKAGKKKSFIILKFLQNSNKTDKVQSKGASETNNVGNAKIQIVANFIKDNQTSPLEKSGLKSIVEDYQKGTLTTGSLIQKIWNNSQLEVQSNISTKVLSAPTKIKENQLINERLNQMITFLTRLEHFKSISKIVPMKMGKGENAKIIGYKSIFKADAKPKLTKKININELLSGFVKTKLVTMLSFVGGLDKDRNDKYIEEDVKGFKGTPDDLERYFKSNRASLNNFSNKHDEKIFRWKGDKGNPYWNIIFQQPIVSDPRADKEPELLFDFLSSKWLFLEENKQAKNYNIFNKDISSYFKKIITTNAGYGKMQKLEFDGMGRVKLTGEVSKNINDYNKSFQVKIIADFSEIFNQKIPTNESELKLDKLSSNNNGLKKLISLVRALF